MLTSELEGAALDLWVAKAEDTCVMWGGAPCEREVGDNGIHHRPFRPSTEWGDAGPIIEREGIGLAFDGSTWMAAMSDDRYPSYFHLQRSTEAMEVGPTALVAAMRAYVAARFGTEVNHE